MYCAHCGATLPEGTTVCGSCGFTTTTPAPAPSGSRSSDPVEELLQETRRAVKDLAAATAKLSKRVATHADELAKDPSGTARRARDRLKKEIGSLVHDVSDVLEKL